MSQTDNTLTRSGDPPSCTSSTPSQGCRWCEQTPCGDCVDRGVWRVARASCDDLTFVAGALLAAARMTMSACALRSMTPLRIVAHDPAGGERDRGNAVGGSFGCQ